MEGMGNRSALHRFMIWFYHLAYFYKWKMYEVWSLSLCLRWMNRICIMFYLHGIDWINVDVGDLNGSYSVQSLTPIWMSKCWMEMWMSTIWMINIYQHCSYKQSYISVYMYNYHPQSECLHFVCVYLLYPHDWNDKRWHFWNCYDFLYIFILSHEWVAQFRLYLSLYTYLEYSILLTQEDSTLWD